MILHLPDHAARHPPATHHDHPKGLATPCIHPWMQALSTRQSVPVLGFTKGGRTAKLADKAFDVLQLGRGSPGPAYDITTGLGKRQVGYFQESKATPCCLCYCRQHRAQLAATLCRMAICVPAVVSHKLFETCRLYVNSSTPQACHLRLVLCPQVDNPPTSWSVLATAAIIHPSALHTGAVSLLDSTRLHHQPEGGSLQAGSQGGSATGAWGIQHRLPNHWAPGMCAHVLVTVLAHCSPAAPWFTGWELFACICGCRPEDTM